MARLRIGRVVITGAAALALVAGGTAAGAAIAAGPVDGSGVIHGCWTNAAINGTHAFVLQDAGTTCPKGTTAISWNQTGPAGPAGPTGATGGTGPAGPAGPIGATGAIGAPGPAGPAGPTGTTGPPGPAGPAGANGNTVLNGAGAPANSLGNDGDFYIDTSADVLYGPKSAGTWPTPGSSLIGTTGPAGAGATVTPLASGNSNCPNGGVQLTDGNGNTAYACTGATGPAGSGTSTAGSSGLDVTLVTSVITFPQSGGGTLQTQAACPSAHPYLIGGSAATGTITNGVLESVALPPAAFASFPIAVNGLQEWDGIATVTAQQEADGDTGMIVYAFCSK